MSILIDSATFDFGYGGSSFYQANAGDLVSARLIVRSLCRVTSVSNPLTLDPTTNQIQSPSVSWLDEGFRVGDYVRCERLTSGGSPIQAFWSQVQYVDDIMCDFTSMPTFYDITSGEIMTFTVMNYPSLTATERDDVDIMLNHVKNSTAGTINSLIDGEVTRLRINGIAALPVGGTINGVVLGNQSGQFLVDGSLTKLPSTDQFSKYQIDLTFVNSGLYDDGSWYFSSECLKAYINTQWARVYGEPFSRYEALYNTSADTGRYDEPYNTGVIDSTLVQGTTDVDYGSTTTHTIIVDGPTSDLMIGSCYFPTDDTYYKNKLYSQNAITMMMPSTPIFVGAILPSYLNQFGGGYEIEITAITSVGSQTTIEFTFTPNTDFESFIDGRDPLDRRFLIWLKCGNINHLVYDDMLILKPAPADPLVMVTSAAFLDHSENVSEYLGSLSYLPFNTEDDYAYFGTFLMTKGNVYDRFSVYMEAQNNATGASFSLRVIQFNFNGVQVSGDGRYLLDEALSVNSELPITSEKINALLKLYPSLDTPTEYGVSIYAPFILNWRYWLSQSNVSTDFYPNQNKNWQQYDVGPDWEVQLRLELVDDLGGHNHVEAIDILDYDSDPNILQTIELYLDATNQNVPFVVDGALHRVVATHTILDGRIWDPSRIWGMITIEPFENQPRWICSSVVDYDFNVNNPLYPLSGTLIQITYPTPETARLECYFNPDLINLSNGVKFTSKIKGCPTNPVEKTMTDGTIKTTTFGTNKTQAV